MVIVSLAPHLSQSVPSLIIDAKKPGECNVSNQTQLVAVYDSHEQAERAVKALQLPVSYEEPLDRGQRRTIPMIHVVALHGWRSDEAWGKIGAFGVDYGGCSLGPHSLQYRALGQSCRSPLVSWINRRP